MATPHMIMTLGKVIVAAAWADGEVAHDEVNSLKDLLFHLPNLNARQWAELEIYLESPVDAAERTRLVEELHGEIRSVEDKQLAISALRDLVEADGVITQEETQVLNEITTAIESADTSMIGSFSRLMRGPVQRRSEVAANAPNREANFEDFVKNKVYYNVRRRMQMDEGEDLRLSDNEIRRLSMAGGLMARIARLDNTVADEEFKAMTGALERDWGLNHEQATFVTEVAISSEISSMDYFRLARDFFDVNTAEERLRFLDALFNVAVADGEVSMDEIEEIRLISKSLKMSHEEFIAAKVKIPREKRRG
jgi:uncharacterized tellurite resistance protein B-like protein